MAATKEHVSKIFGEDFSVHLEKAEDPQETIVGLICGCFFKEFLCAPEDNGQNLIVLRVNVVLEQLTKSGLDIRLVAILSTIEHVRTVSGFTNSVVGITSSEEGVPTRDRFACWSLVSDSTGCSQGRFTVLGFNGLDIPVEDKSLGFGAVILSGLRLGISASIAGI
jgi:hypothetical protein